MRIGRAILPAILTLGVAGAALVGSAAGALAATHAISAQSHAVALAQPSCVYYRG
jgi:hypothetical protein